MAATRVLRLLAALLSAASAAVAHDHRRETETYHVSAGHLLLLRCQVADAHSIVTWSRGGGPDRGLPTGVEVRDGLLWFLPVQTPHNGSYTCETRDQRGPVMMSFEVRVSTGGCPVPLEDISVLQKTNGFLPCKQTEIFRLNNTRTIRWMKDCQPVEDGTVAENGRMMLSGVSDSDAGVYTCLVDISLGGRKYTAGRSVQLTINNNPGEVVLPEPQLVFPKQEVVTVKLGTRAELQCLAYIGFSEDHGTLMFWTVDGVFTEEYEELMESWNYTHRRGRVYAQSTLIISNVLPRFLNVPIHCNVMSAAGHKAGLVFLQEADHSSFYTSVALCLVAVLAVTGLTAAFLFCRVDVVLAYRELSRRFSHRAPDGKLYDAYVSFLQSNSLRSEQMMDFALQVLPEELEKKHGYSLYIRGRDDRPGEAVHDAIAAAVPQCRRLIIILSPDTQTSGEATTQFCHDHSQCSYEQKIAVHEALTQNNPRVILVEFGGPVDYSRLPESLQYIKRRQGALRWTGASLETHKPNNMTNGRFWKKLRYHMPSVPAGSLQTVI